MQGFWTDERLDRAEALWRSGEPYTAIAAALSEPGHVLTRSAVGGIVNRRRWREHGQQPPIRKTNFGTRPGAPVARVPAWEARRLAKAAPPEPGADPTTTSEPRAPGGALRAVQRETDPTPARADGLKGLLELRTHDCRWPVGDPREPGFGFCGRQAPEGSPYCTRHHRAAHDDAAARLLPQRERSIRWHASPEPQDQPQQAPPASVRASSAPGRTPPARTRPASETTAGPARAG